MAEPQTGVIASRYSKFSTDRQPYLDRGRECAKLTIPSLLPLEGEKLNKIKVPYQGVGARGVNNLASKLLLALFPSNLPFFRLQIDDFALAKLAKDPDVRGAVEEALNRYERAVALDIETTAIRVPLFEALKHLIVAGNILLFRDPETGKARAIPLSHYICRRDPLGTVLEIIVKECVAKAVLPDDVVALIDGNPEDKDREEVELFTRIERKGKRWDVTQEVSGVPIPQASGSYPIDKSPWMPLRMILVDGESYGRSFVEEHYADLQSLEKLWKALVQFAAAAAKIVFLVKPNSVTKPKQLSAAESGDFITGMPEDVTALQLQKSQDFQVTKSAADNIEERLAYAFLLNSALQRNGERVTAEEIRRLAQELDTSLGGVHALLAQELQLPLVTVIMAAKTKKKELPPLPKKTVQPVIVTGIQALGRSSDLDNLMTAIQALSVVPNALARLNGEEVGKRVMAYSQVPADGLFYTEQQMQQQQAMATMAEMAKSAAPVAAKAATGQTA